MFTLLEKTIRQSQSTQLKHLTQLEQKDSTEIMKKISTSRKDEVRKLSKKTKEKNELDRLKREVTSRLVEKGVSERAEMEKMYGKYRETLENGHSDVLKRFDEKKVQMLGDLDREFVQRFELQVLQSQSTTTIQQSTQRTESIEEEQQEEHSKL